jgi:hypothetical protein
MACNQRNRIVYPALLFRKSLFYNEKSGIDSPISLNYLTPNKKGLIEDEPF